MPRVSRFGFRDALVALTASAYTHTHSHTHTHTQVGIDAEFVALTAEETELRDDGTNLVTKTSRMSLGRVSVV